MNRLWLVILMMILVLTNNSIDQSYAIDFDTSKVGVNVGDKFTLKVTNVIGNFRENNQAGENFRFEIVNATVSSFNSIIVKDDFLGNIPVYLDQFHGWIIFRDWNFWDVFWETKRDDTNANYSVQIDHKKDTFSVTTITIFSFYDKNVSEYQTITETLESEYNKKTGIANRLLIHQDLQGFDDTTSTNELELTNDILINRSNSLLSLNQVNLFQIIGIGILAFVLIYPRFAKKKKKNVSNQINEQNLDYRKYY